MKHVVYLSILILLGAGESLAQASIAVIVHPEVSIDTVDQRQLLDMYTLEETRWPNGDRIKVFGFKGTPESKKAFYNYLGRRPEDVKRVWLRLMLAGEVQHPTLLRSAAAIQDEVAATPGAIGYVPADAVTDAVKVIDMIEL